MKSKGKRLVENHYQYLEGPQLPNTTIIAIKSWENWTTYRKGMLRSIAGIIFLTNTMPRISINEYPNLSFCWRKRWLNSLLF